MAVRNNPFKPITRAIPAPLRNKYFLVLVFFIMWMIFFDKHQFYENWGLSQKVEQMKADRDYYIEKIEEVKEDEKDLKLNIEKYGRENYFMKKDNEDVFIFEGETED
ncbi:MAG: septum formation initiator family protein [Saprospiraceae bacterium]